MRTLLNVTLILLTASIWVACSPSAKKEVELPFDFEEAKVSMLISTTEISKKWTFEGETEEKRVTNIDWVEELSPIDSALYEFFARPDIQADSTWEQDLLTIQYTPIKAAGKTQVTVQVLQGRVQSLEMTSDQQGTFNKTMSRLYFNRDQGWELQGLLKVYGLEEKQYQLEVRIVT